MKIVNVDIPKDFYDNGIEHIRMERLDRLVLLAGKNGSGKSRILNKIGEALKAKPTYSQIETAATNKVIFQQSLNSLLKTSHDLDARMDDTYLAKINSAHKLNIKRYEDALKEIDALENYNLLETDIDSEKYPFISFVPRHLVLKDCNTYSKAEVKRRIEKLDIIGVDHLPEGSFAKIQNVQDLFWEATHQHSLISEEVRESAINNYKRLQEIIKVFLGTEIERSINGDAMLFHLPLGKSHLSDGQSILLQLCIAIYCQQDSLEELILFLDEPENHIHPSALIETVDRIIKCVSRGQIWISTHSIALLAHVNPDSIWFVEDNAVSRAKNIPEKVLESLLGNEEQISKLQDFIGLPAQYAINKYAFECLFPPSPINTTKTDPQTLQISRELTSIAGKNKIKLLDYGAGKGRLLENIAFELEGKADTFIGKFNYVAFDRFDTDKLKCQNLITQVYGDNKDRYFNETQDLLSSHDSGSFDIVLMCNVLHEIDPSEWLNLFNKEGLINKLLSKKGILLIIEDQQIPVGEKAYMNGFIVLDTPQLKELFALKESDEKNGWAFNSELNGRLKSHRIPKICLSRISSKTKLSALTSLQKIAEERILAIREKGTSYRDGKQHAFWVQQFANTSLALREVK